MFLKNAFSRLLALALGALLVFQLAACGTIIYPERRGQTKGEIDPVVAILNGIGLLLFVVPGLVAFAIDFSTGAIYLPGGQRTKDKLNRMKKSLEGSLQTEGNHLVLRVDPAKLTPELVQTILSEVAGEEVTLDREDLEVHRLEGPAEMAALLGGAGGPQMALAGRF